MQNKVQQLEVESIQVDLAQSKKELEVKTEEDFSWGIIWIRHQHIANWDTQLSCQSLVFCTLITGGDQYFVEVALEFT